MFDPIRALVLALAMLAAPAAPAAPPSAAMGLTVIPASAQDGPVTVYYPTDEAAAIEKQGWRPRLVEGSPLNVKVTRPADLAFAEAAFRAARSRR